MYIDTLRKEEVFDLIIIHTTWQNLPDKLAVVEIPDT